MTFLRSVFPKCMKKTMLIFFLSCSLTLCFAQRRFHKPDSLIEKQTCSKLASAFVDLPTPSRSTQHLLKRIKKQTKIKTCSLNGLTGNYQVTGHFKATDLLDSVFRNNKLQAGVNRRTVYLSSYGSGVSIGERRITIQATNMTIRGLLNEVKKQTDCEILDGSGQPLDEQDLWDDDFKIPVVTMAFYFWPLKSILDSLCAGYPTFDYKIIGFNTIMVSDLKFGHSKNPVFKTFGLNSTTQDNSRFNQRVTVKKYKSQFELFRKLKKQTGISIKYTDLPEYYRTLTCRNIPLRQFLDSLFVSNGFASNGFATQIIDNELYLLADYGGVALSDRPVTLSVTNASILELLNSADQQVNFCELLETWVTDHRGPKITFQCQNMPFGLFMERLQEYHALRYKFRFLDILEVRSFDGQPLQDHRNIIIPEYRSIR